MVELAVMGHAREEGGQQNRKGVHEEEHDKLKVDDSWQSEEKRLDDQLEALDSRDESQRAKHSQYSQNLEEPDV